MRLRLWLVAGLLVGCASSNDALARRDAIRKFNEAQNAPVEPSWRSSAGVRGAVWGMTEEELITLKGEPAQRGTGLLMYGDEIDSAQVPTTYAFFEGHLAQVKSRFEAGREAGSRLEEAMMQKYGPPLSVADKGREEEEAFEAARRWDFASSVLAAVGQVSNYPAYWGFGMADREALRAALRNSQRPARDVLWANPEMSVHLVTLDSGVSEITWSSRRLAGRFMRSQFSAAGLQELTKDL
jgi:hypothetical protein